MKKGAILGIVAASALVGGVTSYGVSQVVNSNNKGLWSFVDYNDKVPTHFTTYDVGSYPDLTYAAENAVKAVVSIDKKGEVRRRSSAGYNPFFEFFGIPEGYGQPQQPESTEPGEMWVLGSGSGVLITPDGYIVTNNHVIDKAGEIDITLNDGRTFVARLVGTDPTTDVALIKIDGQNDLPFLPFGDSDALRLGEWVLAIGTPYSLESTVTAGIVSAKGRNLNVIENDMRLESFIQTDAAVNPGNSGGALVNAKGELVGINTVIKSPTGSFAGYSFAVPSSIVRKVVADLREYGVVQRAMLGIQYQEINAAFIEQMGAETGITEKGGLYVAEVDPSGAAHDAGVKKGDILIEMNGVKLPDAATLSEQIARYRPNDKVEIVVKRGNEVKQFEVTLRNRAGRTELVAKDAFDATEALGGQFAEINDRAKQQLNISHGISVQRIGEGVLKEAGVRQGFIITEINDIPIRSRADLNKITTKISSIDGVYPDGKFIRYSIVNN